MSSPHQLATSPTALPHMPTRPSQIPPRLALQLEDHAPILTQFGDLVDVRRRGALRIMRTAGSQQRTLDAPAVVRLWHEEQCRELSVQQARALANQLLAAADLAEQQNRCS